MTEQQAPTPPAAWVRLRHWIESGNGEWSKEKLREHLDVIQGALAKNIDTASPSPVPAGMQLAPEYRGYAHLGIGAYVINETDAGDPAELIISVASEDEKAGRKIGEERDNPPGYVIQPEAMCVRIRFENVAGLDALESKLRQLRAVHFPLATPQPSPTGPTQVEPGSAERYAEQERKARSVPPTGPREGEPMICPENGKECERKDWCNRSYCAIEGAPETATPSLPLQEPVATNWPFVPERPAEVDQSDGYAVLERMKQWAIGMSFYRAENGYDEPLPRTATIRDVKKEAAYLLPRMERFYASVDLLLRERDQAQALAAPSLPAVLTDADIASLKACIDYAENGSMRGKPNGWHSGLIDAARKALRALATSATPVLP